MDKKTKKIFKTLLPVLILLAGLAIMMILIKSRPEQVKVQREPASVFVEVMEVSAMDRRAKIMATGTVTPAREISVVPQVSGVITRVSRNLVAGGFFKKGDLLFEIDNTDYALILKSAESLRAKAEFELESIKSRAEIARKEWEIMKGSNGEQPNSLVLYEPQLKNGQAALDSSLASVKLAEHNLARTILRAPFDARVRSKSIDVGQYITPGAPVAVLAGTETAEVVVPLKKEELDWVTLPKQGFWTGGSPATVSIGHGTGTFTWSGSVVRSLGEVNPKTKMISVVVEIKDPYGTKNRNKNAKKLLNGSFVNVSITGHELRGVFTLPRSVLREGSTVWTMDEQNLLRIKEVGVLRTEKNRIIIDSGLEDGDKIVLTKISGAANGLRLKTEVAK
jgi:RND family efflux transporter MFP subunit